jgi:imidazolonepropionase-like amidohydrolase
VTWALQEKLRVILAGGTEADQVIELLRRNDIPVIVTDVLREPVTRDAPYDEPFALPARLHAAGIRFAISAGGFAGGEEGDGWALRNLPYHAAMAAAFGLPPEEALRAITLYPARIFGVDDRLGSLEPGRSATLFIADGDILEIPTRVEAAFVDGRPVDLDDRQKALYRKYREKYRQLGIIH